MYEKERVWMIFRTYKKERCWTILVRPYEKERFGILLAEGETQLIQF